jgi:hypothetical protein
MGRFEAGNVTMDVWPKTMYRKVQVSSITTKALTIETKVGASVKAIYDGYLLLPYSM